LQDELDVEGCLLCVSRTQGDILEVAEDCEIAVTVVDPCRSRCCPVAMLRAQMVLGLVRTPLNAVFR
jgi:hypothetical protein